MKEFKMNLTDGMAKDISTWKTAGMGSTFAEIGHQIASQLEPEKVDVEVYVRVNKLVLESYAATEGLSISTLDMLGRYLLNEFKRQVMKPSEAAPQGGLKEIQYKKWEEFRTWLERDTLTRISNRAAFNKACEMGLIREDK